MAAVFQLAILPTPACLGAPLRPCSASLTAWRTACSSSGSSQPSASGRCTPRPTNSRRSHAAALHRGASVQRGAKLVAQAYQQGSSPFPFAERDYVQCELLNRAPYGPMKILPATDQSANTYSGVLVFQRSTEGMLTPETPILEIFVAGDTACNIYTQLHGHRSSRPMVHDLMYGMLTRAAELHGNQWQLLRVAIVALENDIFVGRLFFGNAVTGKVEWDCDCRPSDGVYLSLRTGCPFLVHHAVFEQAAVPIRMSKTHMIALHEAHAAGAAQQVQQEQQSEVAGTTVSLPSSPRSVGPPPHRSPAPQASPHDRDGGSWSTPATECTSGATYTALKPDDPDTIKLLKRELDVAIREEDYASAVRLRDHPYMQMYRRIEAFQHIGRQEEAEALRRELGSMMERDNNNH